MKINFSTVKIKELACFVYEILKEHGIEAILVGGACVSIYSENRYQSYDLDFVAYQDLKSIEKILKAYDFKRTGRCFSHEQCPFVIDFVNPPIAIGKESIQIFETIKTTAGLFKLLTPTDSVKDRLSSYFHWNDEQSLEQALLVAQDQTINMSDVKRWAKAEGYQEKLKHFLKRLRSK